MKKSLRNNWTVAALLFVSLWLASCAKHDDAAHADTFTCPMHPTVISDRPGSCPVCGMDLVRKARAGEEVEITPELARLIKSPNEIIVASIATIKGQYKSMNSTIEAQGIITYDTRLVNTIASKIAGRLEKVYLKYEYQLVFKGQKIAEIYSPELLTAQRELKFLLENDPTNEQLIESARQRLRLLGLSENEITNNKETNTFTIYSPFDGYLITGTTPPSSTAGSQATGGMKGGMNSSSPSSPTQTATGNSIIREGNYVTAGQNLFTVVNTKVLRVELSLPNAHASMVKTGDKVSINFNNGTQSTGAVDLVQPYLSEGRDFVTIRVNVPRMDHLQIGQLVTAALEAKTKEALWVPREAIVDLGTEKIIFVKEKSVFVARQVSIGVEMDKEIEIKQGLSSSDEIAGKASYLVDSESFIKTK